MDTNVSTSVLAATQVPSTAALGSIPLAVTFCIITALTILGNTLVISAVLLVHKLRCPSNFLIVSLAASDLMVSIIVMPFSTYLEYRQYWDLGEVACDIFIVFDVFLCTASILNLCAISIDRYLAVTRPFQYVYKRTPKRMLIMILTAWSISALISIPPIFGFKDEFVPGKCAYSQNFIYQIYACFGAFYIPLIVMLILYGRIVILARRIVKSDRIRLPSKPCDEKRNSIQNYPESQETDEGASEDKSKFTYPCFGKTCCLYLRKRESLDSTDKSVDPNFFSNISSIHSIPTAPVVCISEAGDSPLLNPPHIKENNCPPDPVHHFSRLPPQKSCPNSKLREHPNNGCERSSPGVEFLEPSTQRPQSLFTNQHRVSLHPGAENLKHCSSLLRDRAYSVTVAHIQTKNPRSSLPFFSKQRLSIALHLKRPGIKRSNEAKAIRTLGVIMGVFCICWLPFFIVALGRPLYNYIHNTEKDIDPRLNCFFLWLGYVNSALNPLIYAIFNREFRRPFWELMSCHCLNINARLRERRYQHEYRPPPVPLPNISGGGGTEGETPSLSRSRNSAHLLDRRHSSMLTE
ncbi:D(2) dopamine receptor A [Echinococcus granulosus]|uniref:Biogenic amine 5HT receptor n=1 Tax=Echinococcus granulosus TaxID=6210 RepID=A0A068WVN8_ECHGR|nr:D(2) dopamine receptor A [Echinococcus granulosus]CDS22557.1 biogenic amine 5HT receptor [Echinococcus granulosus]